MLWYVMVCYGMLWYVMLCYGMLWYGMVWYGVVCCVVLCCVALRCVALRCVALRFVALRYVRTSSLADIQALDLLHSQNVNWITTTQINPRHEKMQITFYINQVHLWNNSIFLETICFVLFCARFFICIFIFFYLYIIILEMLGKLL